MSVLVDGATSHASHSSASLRRLVFMENQSPDFDTFSGILINCLRVHECCVWHPASTPVKLRVEALDQHHLLRRLSVRIMPLVLRVRFDGVRLASAVGVDQGNSNEICVWNAMCIRDSEWILQNRLDWAPDVDDLVSCLEKSLSLFREMMWDTRFRGTVRLIDVYTIHRTTKRLRRSIVFWSTSNGVVKDEDSGSTSPNPMSKVPPTSSKHLRIFQQLFGLWVIFSFNLLIIDEVPFITFVGIELESIAIQGVLLDFTTDILNCHLKRLGRSFICLRLANIVRSWLATITGVLVIIQVGVHMVLGRVSLQAGNWFE